MGKSWIAQEYYQQYLDLKERILEMTIEPNQFSEPHDHEALASLVERLRYVLHELKLHGVDMADLILLSVGVEINLFES